MDYILLGNQIRRQRKLKELTLEQLAEKIDVSTTFIGQIERAKGIPSLETMVKIANVLEVSVDSLLFDSLNRQAGDAYFLNTVSELTQSFTSNEKNLLIKNIEIFKELTEGKK